MSLGFYFSNTYDLTNSLALNLTHKMSSINLLNILTPNKFLDIRFSENYSKDWAWNHHLIKEFSVSVKNKRWIIPLIQGYIEQKSINFSSRLHKILCFLKSFFILLHFNNSKNLKIEF